MSGGCGSEHAVEEAACRRLGLLGRFLVETVQRKGVIELGMRPDVDNGCTNVGIVALQKGLLGLVVEADGR